MNIQEAVVILVDVIVLGLLEVHKVLDNTELDDIEEVVIFRVIFILGKEIDWELENDDVVVFKGLVHFEVEALKNNEVENFIHAHFRMYII